MSKKNRLSEETKGKILKCFNSMSYGRISEFLNIPKSTIWFFMKKFHSTGKISNKKSKGAPHKINEKDKKRIRRFIKRNPKTTKYKILQVLNINVSLPTLSKTLKDLKIGRFKLHNKPKISNINKKERLKFGNKHLNWNKDRWSNIIWTDEVSVVLGKKYTQYTWREMGKFDKSHYRCSKQTFITRYKKFFGFFCADGTRGLVETPKPYKSIQYCQILKDNIIMPSLHIGRHLMQDNDKIHVSAYTTKFLKQNKVKLLKWPAQSGDCNPIENLWYILKRRLYSKPSPKTLEELKTKINNIWMQLEDSLLKKLSDSMVNRIKMLVNQNGNPIKY